MSPRSKSSSSVKGSGKSGLRKALVSIGFMGASLSVAIGSATGGGLNALVHDLVPVRQNGSVAAYVMQNQDKPNPSVTFTAQRNSTGDCVVSWTGLPSNTRMAVLNVANLTTGKMIASNLPPTGAGTRNLGPDMMRLNLAIESKYNGWHSYGAQNRQATCDPYSISDSFDTAGPMDGKESDTGYDNDWEGPGVIKDGTATTPDNTVTIIDTRSGDVNVTGTLAGGGGGAVLVTKGKDAQNYIGAQVQNQTYTDAGTKNVYNTREYTYSYDYGQYYWSQAIPELNSRTCYDGTWQGSRGTPRFEKAPIPTTYSDFSTRKPLCGTNGEGTVEIPSTGQGYTGGMQGDLYVNQYNIPVTANMKTEYWTTYTYDSGSGQCGSRSYCTHAWSSDIRSTTYCDVNDSNCYRSYTGYTQVGIRSTTGTQGDYGSTCSASDLCRVDTSSYSNVMKKYIVVLGEKIAGQWFARATHQIPLGTEVTSLSLRNKGNMVSLYYNNSVLLGSRAFAQIGEDSTYAGIGTDYTGTLPSLRTGRFSSFGVTSNA